jgi:hypothetical protein
MHTSITLTFKTAAPASAVLEDLLAAMRSHAMPYELASAGCSSFDLDEIEE